MKKFIIKNTKTGKYYSSDYKYGTKDPLKADTYSVSSLNKLKKDLDENETICLLITKAKVIKFKMANK